MKTTKFLFILSFLFFLFPQIFAQSPGINSVTVNPTNTAATVVFSEPVYSDIGGTGDLVIADFDVSITGGTATLSGYTVTHTAGDASATLNLTLSGTADGSELLTVKPFDGASIYDADSNPMADSESGSDNLNDLTPPVFQSLVISGDNTSATVTFSEAVDDGSGGDLVKADFNVTVTGGTATLSDFTITHTAGNTTATIGLTISGTPDGSEVLTVEPTNGSSIYDVSGNAMLATESITDNLNDKTPPTFQSLVVAGDNNSATVTFSEPVNDGSGGDLVKADFNVTVTGGTATLSDFTITHTAGNTTATIGLTLSGTADGSEVLTVEPADGASIYDASNNAMLATESITDNLHEITPPTFQSLSVNGTNTSATVTFSEPVNDGSGGDLVKADFNVTVTGGTATLSDFTITHTAGNTTATIGLVLSGTADGSEVLTVKPADGSSIYDVPGNAMLATETITDNLNDLAPPVFQNLIVSGDNTSATVTFSEAVDDGSGGDLVKADFDVTVTGGTATLSDYTITHTAGNTTATIGLTISGTPDGSEVLTVEPANGSSIYDVPGNPMLATESITDNLNDKTPPAFQSLVVAGDNTSATVTFNEPVDNGAGGNLVKADFSVSVSGGTATLSDYTVTHTAGNANATIGLTLSGTADGSEVLTVEPNDGASIYDVAGNAMLATQSITDNLNDLVPPTFQSLVINTSNDRATLTLSEGVYTNSDGTGDLVKGDFTLTVTGGSANLANWGIQTHSAGSNTVVFWLNLSGNADGDEVLEVQANSNEIFDLAGNAVSASQALTDDFYDETPPEFQGPLSISADNIDVTVDFTEEVYTTTGASGDLVQGDFSVYTVGGAATVQSFTVTHTAGQTSATLHITYDIIADGSEILHVKPADGSSIYDDADNPMDASQELTITLNDLTPPEIQSGDITNSNAYFNITFTEGIYGGSGSPDPVDKNDFTLTFNKNGGTATNVLLSDITKMDNSTPTGGESILRFHLAVAGTPNGLETIEIIPVSNSVYDGAGNIMNTTPTTGEVNLEDELPPVISQVTATSGNYKVGDDIDIIINADEAGYSVNTIKINGRNATGFTDLGSGSYKAVYTVVEGDDDISSSSDLPIYIIMSDDNGNQNNAYTDDPAGTDPFTIDANSPKIFSMIPAGGNKKIGDTQEITVITDSPGYTFSTLVVNGIDQASPRVTVTDNSNDNYTVEYDIAEGDADVSPGALSIDVVIEDNAGNTASSNTLSSNTIAIDAHAPVITSMSVVDGTYKVGDNVVLTVNADAAGYVSGAVTINGVSGAQITFSDVGGGSYEFTYAIAEGDADVSSGNLTASVVLTDAAGNPSTAFTVIDANSLSIDANTPVITSMSVVDGTYKVGDNVVLTVNADAAGYVSGAVTINGVSGAQITFADAGGGSYEFTYAIAEGDADVSSGNLTASIVLTDAAGNPSTAFTVIDANSLSIDANTPVITSMSVVDGTYKVGDNVVLTVNADAAGYLSGAVTINGVAGAQITFSDVGGGTYRFTYAIAEGDADVSSGNLTASVVLTDAAGNSNVAYTTIVANTLVIDANSPVITSMSVVNGTYKVGDNVVLTVNADAAGYLSGAVTINGVSGAQITFSDVGGGTYRFTYAIAEGDADVSSGNLTASVVLTDAAGNSNVAYTTIVANTLIIDANSPVITSMSVVDGTYKVGNNVVLTVNADAAGYVSGAVTINGVSGSQITFADAGGGTYEFTYAIEEGDADVSSGNLPANVVLTDAAGNSNAAFTTIDANTLSIDANTPVITSMSVVDGTYKVGDNVVLTVNADATGYVSGAVTINGVSGSQITFADAGGGTYEFTYAIDEGDTDVSSGNLTASVVLTDAAGNSNAAFTTIDANTLSIDANSPVIISVSIPNAIMRVSDVIVVTLNVSDDGGDVLSLVSGKIGGFNLDPGSLSRINSTTYQTIFMITDGGNDIEPSADIPVEDVVMIDNAGNTNTPFNDFISQASDPIYANLPTAFITGSSIICLYDSVGISVVLEGRDPWTIIYSDGATSQALSNINSSPFVFYVHPDQTSTYSITNVEDSTGNTNNGSGTYEITVNDLPVVEIIGLNSNYNLMKDAIPLNGNPVGGNFFGPGVYDFEKIFSPKDAGLGVHEIIYKYTDANSCINYDTVEVTVIDAEGEITSLSGNDDFIYCYDGAIDTLQGSSVGGEPGGKFSGDGVDSIDVDLAIFDPALAGAGTHQVYYTYIKDSVPLDIIETFTVDSIGEIDFVGLASEYCINNDMVELTPISPDDLGGTGTMEFSGSLGISGNTFNPNNAAIGSNSVDLTYTRDFSGCIRVLNRTVEVYDIPHLDFAVSDGCVNDRDSTIFFNLTNSIDPVITWKWDFDDPASLEENTSNQETPKHQYPGFGRRSIEMIGITDKNCRDTLVRDVDFEEKPLAGFEWENECYSENKSIPFKDNTFSNSTITNYLWKFYDTNGIDTLATYNTEDTVFVFPTQSDYPVELIVNTANGCTDTIKRTIQLRPTIRLADGVYYEDFESGPQGWIAEADDISLNSWELGLPSNNIINSAASGNNSWVTELDGNHFDSENSWITSPCFDFREMNRPMIKMDILINSEGDRDGAVLQFSINNGIDWSRVGEFGDGKGLDWFNSVGILGNPGGQQQGWSGTGNNNWQEVRHDLDQLIGSNGVQFRVAFGAGAEGNMEGFAFDNVWIGERTRKVILEHFTNTTESVSEKADSTVNAIANKDTLDIIDIQYHTNFPGSDMLNEYYPAGPGARAIYYGVSDVPYSIMDGWEYFEGFDDQDNYLWKESDMLKRSLYDPQVKINLSAQLDGNTLNVNVTVDTLKPVPSNHEITLHIVILENQVESGDKTYENIIRKMLPDPGGTQITNDLLQGSISISESWTFNSSEINRTSLIVVAFVQDEETAEIFQAAALNYAGIITGITIPGSEIRQLTFNIYPNPASGSAVVEFTQILLQKMTLEVYNQLGRLIEIKEIESGINRFTLNTNHYNRGVYYLKISDKDKVTGIKRLVIIK